MIRRRIGIDTSVLVRLVTGHPPDIYALCVERLTALVADGSEIFASNQVIGETFVVVQHYYGATKEDARAELRNTLSSGLVAPLNGLDVIEALSTPGGPGLFDRLIANDYARADSHVLTLDRKMSSLPDVGLL